MHPWVDDSHLHELRLVHLERAAGHLDNPHANHSLQFIDQVGQLDSCIFSSITVDLLNASKAAEISQTLGRYSTDGEQP